MHWQFPWVAWSLVRPGWRLPCAQHGPHNGCTGVTAGCMGHSVSPGRLTGVSHVHNMGPTVWALGSQLCIWASLCPQEGWMASPMCTAWAPQCVHWGHSCAYGPVRAPRKAGWRLPCAQHGPHIVGTGVTAVRMCQSVSPGRLVGVSHVHSMGPQCVHWGSQLCAWVNPCRQEGWLASPMCTSWAPQCVHGGHSCVSGPIRVPRKAGWRLPCAQHGPHSVCTGVTAVRMGQSVPPGRLVGVSHVHSMGPTLWALGSQLCACANPCRQEGW